MTCIGLVEVKRRGNPCSQDVGFWSRNRRKRVGKSNKESSLSYSIINIPNGTRVVHFGLFSSLIYMSHNRSTKQ